MPGRVGGDQPRGPGALAPGGGVGRLPVPAQQRPQQGHDGGLDVDGAGRAAGGAHGPAGLDVEGGVGPAPPAAGAVVARRRPAGQGQGPQQVGVQDQAGGVAPSGQGRQGPVEQEELLGRVGRAQVGAVAGQALGGLHHGGGAGEHGVVAGEVPAEGLDGLRLGDDVEAAPGAQLDVDEGEGLQARAEAGGRAAHAPGDGAHLPVGAGEGHDDPVRLAEPVGAQDHGLVAVELCGHARRSAQRRARLTAEMTALKEEVVMEGSMPTPHRTCPAISHST